MYRITLLLLCIFLAGNVSYAAFPVNQTTVVEQKTSATLPSQKSFKKSPPAPKPPFGYSKGRSYIIALLLSVFLGPLGAHNFYLGYYLAGAGQLLTFAAIVGLIATATGFGTLLLIMPLVLGLGIWVLIDLILIAAQVKLPKNGDYY